MSAPKPIARGPVSDEVRAIVDRYIATHQGWPIDDYYVESTDSSDRQGHPMLHVVYKADLQTDRGGYPRKRGGGKSMNVVVDLTEKRVVQVYRFQ